MSAKEIKAFRMEFAKTYPHIGYELSDKKIQKFLEHKHIKDMPLDHQMDVFQDYLVGNDLCEVWF